MSDEKEVILQEEDSEENVEVVEEEQKDKKPTRSDRLKRQRDQYKEVAERLEGELTSIRVRLDEQDKERKEAKLTQIDVIEEQLNTKLEQANKELAEAFDSSNKDTFIKAQRTVTQAEIQLADVKRAKEWQKQRETQQQPRQQPQRQGRPNPVAEDWLQRNSWIRSDGALRGYVLGLDQQLVNEGSDPFSEDHYEELDKKIHAAFPDRFKSRVAEVPPVGGVRLGGRVTTRRYSDEELTGMRRMGIEKDVWDQAVTAAENKTASGYGDIPIIRKK